jgi:hypothetical protein
MKAISCMLKQAVNKKNSSRNNSWYEVIKDIIKFFVQFSQ